jgi:hypothetical protein
MTQYRSNPFFFFFIYHGSTSNLPLRRAVDDAERLVVIGERAVDANNGSLTVFTDTIVFSAFNDPVLVRRVFDVNDGLGDICKLSPQSDIPSTREGPGVQQANLVHQRVRSE